MEVGETVAGAAASKDYQQPGAQEHDAGVTFDPNKDSS